MRALAAYVVATLTLAAHTAMLAHVTFARVRAPRLHECCDKFSYKRANFDCIDGQTLVGNTLYALTHGGLCDGMLLRAQSPPSKADAGGMVWDGKYM